MDKKKKKKKRGPTKKVWKKMTEVVSSYNRARAK